MSSAHAGRWRLRPHDPKCKTFIDPDPVVEGQIRCKVPLWSGDFDELKPELTAQGVRLDDLPKLTVYDVGQYVIRAAQGGSLQCGPVGTAADTIVGPPPPHQPADENNWHAGVARRLEVIPRKVLWFMRENNAHSAVDKLTRQFIADELRISIDDVQAAGESLRGFERRLLDSKDGRNGGWWLCPDGDLVAGHCAPPTAQVAPMTRSYKNT
jgi:hypothetical protein